MIIDALRRWIQIKPAVTTGKNQHPEIVYVQVICDHCHKSIFSDNSGLQGLAAILLAAKNHHHRAR